jgi:hypothetical protein
MKKLLYLLVILGWSSWSYGDVDTDQDGIADAWETAYGLNPADPADAMTDPDGDGVASLQEYQELTHPTREPYYVSPYGDDTAAGRRTSPWRTIQRGINQIRAGDTLIVMAGTYNEFLNITRRCNGYVDCYTTIRTEGEVWIRDPAGYPTGFSSAKALVVMTGDLQGMPGWICRVKFEGFNIFTTIKNCVMNANKASSVVIKNNLFQADPTVRRHDVCGLQLDNCQSCIVSGNECSGLKSYGSEGYSGYYPSTYGVWVGNNCSSCVIVGNRIYNNVGFDYTPSVHGIYLSGTNNEACENILANNADSGAGHGDGMSFNIYLDGTLNTMSGNHIFNGADYDVGVAGKSQLVTQNFISRQIRIVSKATNVSICNNVFSEGVGCIQLGVRFRSDVISDIKIMNNSFYSGLRGSWLRCIVAGQDGYSYGVVAGLQIANNIFYSENATVAGYYKYSGVEVRNLSIDYNAYNSNMTGLNTPNGKSVTAGSFCGVPQWNHQWVANSPCRGAGSDGTDIGIFGGLYAFADSDQDGLPDDWETYYGLSTTVPSANDDPDADTLANIIEWALGTDPTDADSDADGLPDGWEFSNGLYLLIDDSMADPDNDGLSNGQEYLLGTNIRQADTDRDGISDANEDFDGDGVSNLVEFQQGTDPTLATKWLRYGVTSLGLVPAMDYYPAIKDLNEMGEILIGSKYQAVNSGYVFNGVSFEQLPFGPVGMDNNGLITAVLDGNTTITYANGSIVGSYPGFAAEKANENGMMVGYQAGDQSQVLLYGNGAFTEVPWVDRSDSMASLTLSENGQVLGTDANWTLWRFANGISSMIEAAAYFHDMNDQSDLAYAKQASDGSARHLDFVLQKQGKRYLSTVDMAANYWDVSMKAMSEGDVVFVSYGSGWPMSARILQDNCLRNLVDTIEVGSLEGAIWDVAVNDYDQIAVLTRLETGDFKLYMLTLTNQDTDGDGMSDYQEYELGNDLN